MIIWLAACAVVAAAVEDVPPLTVVSGANGRYALKELAVLLDIKDRARQENLPVRLIAYNLGQLGECADGDAGKAAPSSLWDSFGIEYRHFDFRKYPPHDASETLASCLTQTTCLTPARTKARPAGSLWQAETKTSRVRTSPPAPIKAQSASRETTWTSAPLSASSASPSETPWPE